MDPSYQVELRDGALMVPMTTHHLPSFEMPRDAPPLTTTRLRHDHSSGKVGYEKVAPGFTPTTARFDVLNQGAFEG